MVTSLSMGIFASTPPVSVSLGINDLPDELILMIWKKLCNVDVLHAFVGVNRRFDRLIRDSLFCHTVHMTSGRYVGYPLAFPVLERYCLEILPQIGRHIRCLVLEWTSAERVLQSSRYPHLYKLVFARVTDEFASAHFHDQSTLWRQLRFQITHVCIGPTNYAPLHNILPQLIATFPHVSSLELDPENFSNHWSSILDTPSSTYYSSSVAYLDIGVKTYDDCIRLLDGRFPRLSQLYILIEAAHDSKLSFNDLTSLSSMRSFSLTTLYGSIDYDSYVLPLIQRMVNLEQLCLFINSMQSRSAIDGIHLKRELLAYLPQLQAFTMNLATNCQWMDDTEHRRSSDELRRTFVGWPYGRMTGYITHSSDRTTRYHIYSLPGSRTASYSITGGFSGDQCDQIRRVYLHEYGYPLTRELFVRIARAFPRVAHLSIFAYDNHATTDEANGEKVPIAEFPSLRRLAIHSRCSPAYLEYFLLDTHTYLPKMMFLETSFRHLLTVTNNFTREATRRNCSTVQSLTSNAPSIIDLPPQFFSYFPRLR